MTIRYALMDIGLEYNDENYRPGGEGAKVLRKTYATAEEAKIALRVELQELIKDFDLRDFGEDTPRDIFEYLREVHGDEWHYGAKWSEYIEWNNQNGYDWYPDAPHLLQISEIEVD